MAGSSSNHGGESAYNDPHLQQDLTPCLRWPAKIFGGVMAYLTWNLRHDATNSPPGKRGLHRAPGPQRTHAAAKAKVNVEERSAKSANPPQLYFRKVPHPPTQRNTPTQQNALLRGSAFCVVALLRSRAKFSFALRTRRVGVLRTLRWVGGWRLAWDLPMAVRSWCTWGEGTGAKPDLQKH